VPARRRRHEGGFSLIELLLALGIVALIGGMMFVDYSDAAVMFRLKSAARKLAGYGEMIRANALSKGVTCRFEVDFDKSRYRFLFDPPRDEFGRFISTEDEEELVRPLTEGELKEWDDSFPWDDFPKDVFPARLVISAREYYDKNVVSWPFWPDGSTSSFVLVLKTAQGNVASVSMNGLTGTASAETDVVLGFPEADASDFSNIMGNKAPGVGQSDASSPSNRKDAGGAK
jgi:hypothetical protein